MKRATSPGVSAPGGRYARPPGFDHKADLVRKQMLLARMRSDGVAQSVIDIFTGAGEQTILDLDDRRIEALTCLTKEQRCAAIGMRAEGSSSREAADYLISVADESIADAVAQHEHSFRRSQAAHVPVPPLKLGDLAGAIERRRLAATTTSSLNGGVVVSPATRGPARTPTRGSAIAAAGGGVSPASSRPSTPRVVAYGASLSPHSAVLLPPPGSSTPRRRLYSEGPGGQSPKPAAVSTGGSATPRSSYYRQQSQQMRLERLHSETQHTQQRRRAEARTEYDRERSRSRSRSPGVTSDGASQRARPKLWEPRHTSPRLTPVGGMSARDRKHLRTTFGESAHRASYLPPSVQHAAHRATRASDFGGPHRLNPSLHSAFERLDSAGTSKRAGAASGGRTPRRGAATPPPSVRRPVSQQQQASPPPKADRQKSPEPRPSPGPSSAPPPATEKTASASPEPHAASEPHRQPSTPRLSATRERKILDDFHAMLQRENVLPDVWATLTAAEHERRFDEWGCPRATRHVVRQAYSSAANKA